MYQQQGKPTKSHGCDLPSPTNKDQEPSMHDGGLTAFEYEIEWDLLEWGNYAGEGLAGNGTVPEVKMEDGYGFVPKGENVEFLEAKNDLSLNLSLNYQEVMDAWSDQGPLSFPAADDCSISESNITTYAGEVPVMGEERERRRARVEKYREKRQSRLFSKKIRYEVRKLNAEKRPRLKGRFVKRAPGDLMR